MKFGAVICLYDDHEYLDVVLESIAPHLDHVLFLLSDIPWNGVVSDNSETISAVTRLVQANPKFEFIRGRWESEIEQRNFGLSIFSMRKIDYCFVVDTDEIYHEAGFKNVLKFITLCPQADAFHIEWNTYWTKEYHRIWPREPYKPLLCVKVNKFEFNVIRGGTTAVRREGHKTFAEGDGYNAVLIPAEVALCYHLSYARTDDYMRRKLETNSHAKDFIPGWFDQVWARWTPEMINLHPIMPEQYARAIPEFLAELPLSLQKFIAQERRLSLQPQSSVA